MTTTQFPNPERILTAEFDEVFTWGSGAVTPADLEKRLPYVTIRRIGGNTDPVNDYPLLQIDVYAATFDDVYDVAEDIRGRLLAGHITGPYGQIDRMICTSAHIELPAENTAVRRVSTQYRATCRRMPV